MDTQDDAIYRVWIHLFFLPEKRKTIWSELQSNPGPLPSQATALTTRACIQVSSIFTVFSDNDFELLSPEIKNLVNLRILAIRDNELVGGTFQTVHRFCL